MVTDPIFACGASPFTNARTEQMVRFAPSVQYEELVATGRAGLLSPFDLKRRVLLKGKVKPPRKQLIGFKLTRHIARASAGLRVSMSRNSRSRPETSESTRESEDEGVSGQKERPSSDFITKTMTDDLYASVLSLRSVPLTEFLGRAPKANQLSITSIREDSLLKELGLPLTERNQIEGLQSGASASRLIGGLGLTEAQLAALAIVRLAHNPPPQVGHVQRCSTKRLFRP